jgi:hypothetical protein
MNDELEMIWKSWVYWKVLSGNSSGGNEENHENPSQDCLSPNRDLNQGPPEYEGVLTTRPRRSIDDECDKLLMTLDGGERSASRPGRALLPGKGPPVPIVQEAGWAPEPVWTQRLEEKSFSLCRGSNLDRPFVQRVARHYTDWATRLT